MTALARTKSNCIRQTHPLAREDVATGLSLQMFRWKIKILVVGFKGLVTKTN
jgi:hypothetical protein